MRWKHEEEAEEEDVTSSSSSFNQTLRSATRSLILTMVVAVVAFQVRKRNTVWCKFFFACLNFPAFLPPTNLGLPMHSSSSLMEHVSLNLATFYFARPCTC